MNWKTLLSAAALLGLLLPSAALSRNHPILDGGNSTGIIQNGASAIMGGSGGSSMFSAHGSAITAGASPITNSLTNNLTNNGLFGHSNGILGTNNNGLLNNVLHKTKKKRNWLSRLFASLPLFFGKFQNGHFNNNGSMFGNSGNSGLRGLLGR